ncbi:MAG: hypothetical protein AAGI10_05530 [Pseudomonadota bacterium]
MTRIEDLTPAALLDAALKANGPLKVLKALLRTALKPRRRAPYVQDLPAHLRRDIGMPPQVPPPTRWEHLR